MLGVPLAVSCSVFPVTLALFFMVLVVATDTELSSSDSEEVKTSSGPEDVCLVG